MDCDMGVFLPLFCALKPVPLMNRLEKDQRSSKLFHLAKIFVKTVCLRSH